MQPFGFEPICELFSDGADGTALAAAQKFGRQDDITMLTLKIKSSNPHS